MRADGHAHQLWAEYEKYPPNWCWRFGRWKWIGWRHWHGTWVSSEKQIDGSLSVKSKCPSNMVCSCKFPALTTYTWLVGLNQIAQPLETHVRNTSPKAQIWGGKSAMSWMMCGRELQTVSKKKPLCPSSIAWRPNYTTFTHLVETYPTK